MKQMGTSGLRPITTGQQTAQMVQVINSQHPIEGVDVTTRGTHLRLMPRRGRRGLSLAKFAFGIAAIAGPVVTVYPGRIVRGKVAYGAAQADVTVTGGTNTVPHYIYAQLSGTTATIVTTATATYPVSDDSIFRRALYAVGLNGGVAYVVPAGILSLGDIVIWGAFAQ